MKISAGGTVQGARPICGQYSASNTVKIHITITIIDNVSSTNACMVSRAHVKGLQRCSTVHRACMAGARSQSMIKRPPTLVSSARRRQSTWPASCIMLKVLCPALFALSHRWSRQPQGCWTTPSTTPWAHCMECNGRRILAGRSSHRARTRDAPKRHVSTGSETSDGAMEGRRGHE